MTQTFEYMRVQTAMDSITVDSVGNVVLEANNDEGLYWYFSTFTSNGYTDVIEVGPFQDGHTFKYGCSFNKYRMEYDEKKLCKSISVFINNTKRAITQVQEIDTIENVISTFKEDI